MTVIGDKRLQKKKKMNMAFLNSAHQAKSSVTLTVIG